jgi:hypothetical protein
VRIGSNNLLSIEFKNQTEHTVSCGMLGTKVHSIVADFAVFWAGLILELGSQYVILVLTGTAEARVRRNKSCSLGLVDICITAGQ